MATKTMRYDHPAYIVPFLVSKNAAAGASASKAKFVAFTSMLAKSATAVVTVAGTTTGAAAGITFNHISGTTTTSVGQITVGTGVAFTTTTNVVLASGTAVLAQGDLLQGDSGADATLDAEIAYEFLIQPRATVTSDG